MSDRAYRRPQVRVPENTEFTGARCPWLPERNSFGQRQGKESSKSRTCQMFAGRLSPFTLTHSNVLGSTGCWLREN